MYHHLQEEIRRPAAEVAAVIGARPSTWLRRFLHLALADPAAGIKPPPVPDATAWFRLGALTPTDDGAVAVTFFWRPRVGDVLFDRFKGRFVVREERTGTTLVLEGDTTAGTVATNAAVLRVVLRLLAGALTAGQRPDG